MYKPAAQPVTHGDNVSVTVRASGRDDYAGLRGHDYIKARNLNVPAQRVQTSAHAALAVSAKGQK